MKPEISIEFLGTCACDFSPKLECELKDCFDKNARRSSSILIDGRFLVDCGVHTLESMRIAGIDKVRIEALFITHLHRDHFDRANISALAMGRKEPMPVFVREGADLSGIENIRVIPMVQFEKYQIEDGVSVVGCPANHDPDAHPQHFVFEIGEKKIFYGCDGGWLLNPTYNFLRRARLDVAILDCTVGDYEGDFRMAEHNSIPMIRLMLPSLEKIEMITSNTRIYLSHLAPSLHKTHEKTEEIARGFGATVAYDGMKILF